MYLYLTKQTHLIWDGSVIETTLPVYQVSQQMLSHNHSSLHIVHNRLRLII